MNLNYLEAFLTLSDTLSFTETARRLGLTQPSVSRQIKLLEEELKAQLFIRDKHAVRLTREGKEMRSTLSPLVEEIRGAFERSVERASGVAGALTLGCLPEVGRYFFFQHVLEFQRENPAVDFHVRYELQHVLMELIRAGEIDFAIVSKAHISESIRSYKLVDERAVLVTRTQSRLKEADLAQAEFVGYSKTDALLDAFLRAHFPRMELGKIKRLSSVNSHASMLETLLAKDCLAVLPYFTVHRLIEKKELRLASDKESRNALYLVFLESQLHSRRNEAFRKFLQEKCKTSKLG
jgi:DNA-binding transcriptional LysR family regulator